MLYTRLTLASTSPLARSLLFRARAYATTAGTPNGTRTGGNMTGQAKTFYEKNGPLVWLAGVAGLGGLYYYAREQPAAPSAAMAQNSNQGVEKK